MRVPSIVRGSLFLGTLLALDSPARAADSPDVKEVQAVLDKAIACLRSRQGDDGIESELAAFEVFDADCNKIFDTNEDSPCELQEENAKLAAAAPTLLASLIACANLLADYDESDGPEGEAYREALAAINDATGWPACRWPLRTRRRWLFRRRA